jgi:hypothetical protein
LFHLLGLTCAFSTSISTRIRGLVAGAREVQVALLTTEEAVDMLCMMSELDASDVIASDIMPVIRLCGNLPLCLSVAAGMIRANKNDSSAKDSIADVLMMLQDDKAGALTEEAEFSVSELIVGRSVRCLPNQDARDLFAYLGACPEDASIPSSFIVFLWEAKQVSSTKSKLRLKSTAKRLTRTLVLNNLLHENASSYTIHDILRGSQGKKHNVRMFFS